jgi:hypothetical protein
MKSVLLFHSYFDKDKLNDVKKEMVILGAPSIRAIYDEGNGIWMAVEGCHRLRAAKELGLIPTIIPITEYDESITIQYQDEETTFSFLDLCELLTTNTEYRPIILDFDEDIDAKA